MYLALSFILACISVVLGFALLDQYRINRRSYQLTWAGGLFLATVTAALWFTLEAFPLNAWVYKLWYFAGAMALPAILATGVLLLVAPRNLAGGILGFLAVSLMAGASVTLAAGFETPGDCPMGLAGLDCLYGNVPVTGVGFFLPAVFILSLLLQVYALVTIVAGAVWAAAALVIRQQNPSAYLAGEGSAPDGSAALVSRDHMVAFFKAMPAQLGAASQILRAHRDFWNRDRLARRGAGATIMAVGAGIIGIGVLLDYLGLAAVNLWLSFLGLLVFYVGMIAMQHVFEESPMTTLSMAMDTMKGSSSA